MSAGLQLGGAGAARVIQLSETPGAPRKPSTCCWKEVFLQLRLVLGSSTLLFDSIKNNSCTE